MTNWISCEERMPEWGKNVLICLLFRGNYSFDVDYRTPHNTWSTHGNYYWVTHWMPLPEPPEGE